MYLKSINRAYWYIGILLFLISSFNNIKSEHSSYLNLVQIVVFILFGIIVNDAYKRKIAFFTKQNLVFSVFACSVLGSVLYQTLSYYIDGDLFVFSKADALLYFNESMKMRKMEIWESYLYLSQTYSFDDWGAFLWATTLFRIIPSKLFLTFSCCVVGSIYAVMLFDIGRCLMPRRYAYMAALTFSTASFMIVRHSASAKESIFIFLVIAAFHSFYLFLRCKKKCYIVLTIVYIASILLFRVPVALLLFASLGLTLVLIYSRGLIVSIVSILIILAIYSSSFFAMTYESYLRGGDVELIVERKNELAGSGGVVNQLADPLAALIGPFPSVAITEIKNTPLYSSGLLYRLLLAAPFFIGTYYVLRYKHKKMYPLVFFFFTNAVGVAISVKGLETRLSAPHLSMMYLVAFWWLAMYDYKRIRLRKSKVILNGFLVVVLVICLVWNMRDFIK